MVAITMLLYFFTVHLFKAVVLWLFKPRVDQKINALLKEYEFQGVFDPLFCMFYRLYLRGTITEMFKLQKGHDWIADMSVLNKFFYASVKISVGLIYLRLVKVSWGNASMILATGLLFRFLNAPFTMVIIGCSIALYLKDSLINTNSKKTNQNPD